MQQGRELSRLEVLRGLNISIWEGIWATVWTVLTTGAFQTGFALQLGASPFALGLMAGLPAAVNLLQLPASLYVEKRGERRRFVGAASVTGRLLWLIVLLIPFVLPRDEQLVAFLTLLTLSSALLSIVVPPWTSWMSDLVPASSRGEYFGRRNMLLGIVVMLVPLPAGAFLDQSVKYGRFDARLGFAILFFVACFAALGAFYNIMRQPEPPMVRNDIRENPLRSLAAPLQDRAFRPFLIFSALTVIGQTLAGQFFTTWQLDKAALNLPYFTVQMLAALSSGAALLSTPFWGYLADKYGGRPILVMCSAGTIIAPFLWTLTNPSYFWMNVGLIVLINLCSGAFWAGLGLAQFNLLLSASPPEKRGTYVAMFSAATGVVGFIFPILGGAAMALLAPFSLQLGPVLLNNYKWMFLLTVLIRVACWGLVTRLRVEENTSTWYVLEQIWASRPLSSYVRARRLTQAIGEATRRQTVGELAELRSPLVVEELTTALEDVSLQVREQAARALGRIGDPRAVPALAARLNDPAAGIGELVAEALGEIGSREATEYLVEATRGPDASVRIASIKAMARIADPASVPALVLALDPAHPSRCEAACAALSAIAPEVPMAQAHLAQPRLLYLLSQEVDRGMRFAAARTLAAMARVLSDNPVVFDTLSTRLFSEEDHAVLAQEAIALEHLANASQRPITDSLRILLPVLHRLGTHGLAYKQALGAIADLALPSGTLYPFLSLKDMARDQAVNRLLEEIRRKVGDQDTTIGERYGRAMDAYGNNVAEDFFAEMEWEAPKGTGKPTVVIYQFLKDRAHGGYSTPEEMVLALLLIRAEK
jgi:MFS family permease